MIAGARCDVLVIGHGAAGCMAAATLASRGVDVILVGRGYTATELSTARMSLPAGERGLADLLRRVGDPHGLYHSAGKRDAITNIGTMASQDLTSPHDWLSSEGRAAVLGLRGNDDLDPDLLCASLSRRHPGLRCRPLWADPGVPTTIDAGQGGALSEEAREAIDRLSGTLSEIKQETVVLPPVFAGPSHDRALCQLEKASGRVVREPATPLSNPGRRLQACLESYAASSGCRLLLGREVRTMHFNGGRATSAVVRSGLREQCIEFQAAVLATGGLVGGGLAVGGDRVLDPMGLFAVGGPGGPVLTAALSSGIRHHGGRALRADGTMAANVVAAGSSLPGMAFPLERGLGDVISSALGAASLAMEGL